MLKLISCNGEAPGHVPTLNEVFSTLSVRRRYEVWFLRLGLADGGGAWWFRYLLMNPGRSGCANSPQGQPIQVWATWFPTGATPQSFIQGFAVSELNLSGKAQVPLHFQAGENEIGENYCRGALNVDGHHLKWNLQYQSNFKVILSSKGWIGFSRTPHSDAVFSGEITLDGRRFAGDPLGFGVQGHNCGYRHRNFWRWTHAYFRREGKPASTLEALVYEMPLGLVFRKAVLWHDAKASRFGKLREVRKAREEMHWEFACTSDDGIQLDATIDGRGPSLHRLPYVKTNCSGTFEVSNNSLASAAILIRGANDSVETLETSTGAVLEMVG
ncbi:MAG: hypothetical protein DMG99_00255 [Acidobacteria bacterium]|nr:MAG: hypothetical protein DMG99_00255 [Acidobacteriota bacterium]